jgi:Fur family ferric uptake transcriptional regulator
MVQLHFYVLMIVAAIAVVFVSHDTSIKQDELLLHICRSYCYNCSMSEPIDQLQLTLQHHGFSSTMPRSTVFQALLDAEPQTIQHIIAVCKNRVDRASVYRTIDLFEKLGIVQRLNIGWKYKLELTDRFMHHHHHMSCVGCGQVFALPEDDDLENRLKSLAKMHDFQPHNHQIEIRGLCVNCKASS